MVHGRPARFVVVALEHREVLDPEERERALVDQAELAAEVEAERAEHAGRRRPRVGGEEERLAVLAAERGELGLREELGDRRADLAAVEDEVGEPLCPPLLRELLELRELAAAVRLRDAEEAHRLGAGEDAELGAARRLGRVLHLELEARVRLVGAEAAVGLLERHPRERRRDLEPEALAPDPGEHLLHQREQELLVRERHLDVELGDLLDAVGAEILVPEADRDLVVAVEPGDHRQLLEDLRALRKRVEAARLEAARNDEVASALGCRLEEDRRLDVEEAGLLHRAADDPDHLRAQADVPLELVAAEVEPAIAQAQRLVDVLLVELEGERGRAADDLERIDLQLDLAGRHVRVDGLRRARDELALGAKHELVPDPVRELRRLGRLLGVDHELGDAAAVAEVDEDEPAVVAPARRPAGKDEPLADQGRGRLSAHVGPPRHPSSQVIRAVCRERRRARPVRPARPGGGRSLRRRRRSRSWAHRTGPPG